MTFDKAAKLASLVSKEYAQEFFKLLVVYETISASEAASRLNLHIKTAQDFLNGLEEAGILSKQEVSENKRPYFRYTLIKRNFSIDVDLSKLVSIGNQQECLKWKIREKINSGAIFSTSFRPRTISSVSISEGKGRNKKERKINFTHAQGQFFFYLPFPTEEPIFLDSILKKADINLKHLSEVLDILVLLESYCIIEIDKGV
jgi:hypothetical protein